MPLCESTCRNTKARWIGMGCWQMGTPLTMNKLGTLGKALLPPCLRDTLLYSRTEHPLVQTSVGNERVARRCQLMPHELPSSHLVPLRDRLEPCLAPEQGEATALQKIHRSQISRILRQKLPPTDTFPKKRSLSLPMKRNPREMGRTFWSLDLPHGM